MSKEIKRMIIVRPGKRIETYDEFKSLRSSALIYFKSPYLESVNKKDFYETVGEAVITKTIEHGFFYNVKTEIVSEDEETDKSTMNAYISVNEKTPDDERYVLVLTKSKNGSRNVDKGYYLPDSGKWATRGTAKVTHWMEIPEFPEDTEDER